MAEKDEDDPCDLLEGTPTYEYCTGEKEAPGDGGVPTSPFDAIAQNFSEAASSLVKDLATFWFDVSNPTLSTDRGPVASMFENIEWITAWVAVLALLLAAGRMAWERRAEPAQQALGAIIRLVLSTSAVVVAANLVLKGGDAFSHWIVNRSTGCEKAAESEACVDAFGERVLGMTTTGSPASSALVLILALLLIVASLVQIVLLLARGAMLIVLLGTLPMAAALSSTQVGRNWWQKSIAWILAFLLYKPTAALVYAAGFAAAGTKNDSDLITQVSGVMLLVLSALTLPALMRLATPLVDSAAIGGGSRVSTVRSVASGALMIRGRAGAKSSTGGGPSGGPGPAGIPGGRTSGPAGGGGPAGRQPGGPSSPNGAGSSTPAAPRQAPAGHSTGQPAGGAPTASHGPQRPVTDPRTTPPQGGPRGSR